MVSSVRKQRYQLLAVACLCAVIPAYAARPYLLRNLARISRGFYNHADNTQTMLSIAGGVGLVYGIGRLTVYRSIQDVSTNQKFTLLAGALMLSLVPYVLVGSQTAGYTSTILSNSRDTTAAVVSIYVRRNVKGPDPEMAVAAFFPPGTGRPVVFERYRGTLAIGDLLPVRYYIPNPDHFIVVDSADFFE